MPRVFVAVDVMNVWYTGREQHGDGTRIQYSKLKELIYNRFPGHIISMYAYTVTTFTRKTSTGKTKMASGRNNSFLNHLSQLGFVVKNRSMIKLKNIEKPFGTDWDVGITLDAMKAADNYDVFVLVSGDGDYSLLLEELKTQGKRVEVVTFEFSTSKLLHRAAHDVILITENELFNTRAQYATASKEKSR